MTIDHEYDYGPDHEHVDNDISFAARVSILSEVWARKDEMAARSEGWAEFITWADYSLMLATDLHDGVDRNMTEDDFEMLLDAWIDFTHLLDIDHHQPFETLGECLEVSKV